VGLWRTVRREVTGAWRSARYDVDRHVGHHRATKLRQAETAEMVVRQIVWQKRPSPRRPHRSTELPWAGRRPVAQLSQPPQPKKPRRRAVATTGVALLVAGGAAGTYLAVAGSLVGMNADAQEPVGPPLAAPVAPATVPAAASTPRTTTSPAQRSHRRAAAAPIPPAGIPPVGPPAAPAPTKSIEATPTTPSSATPTADPTPTPSASGSPSPSVSNPATDQQSAQFTGRHRWRHSGQNGDGR
jgi:hypothetical protein